MGRDRKTFKTVALEDGTFAVVRTDPSKPRMLEVVAMFYDAARARKYADIGEQPVCRVADRSFTPSSSRARIHD